MAAVSNSVVHLTMRFGSTVLSFGTGVLYERGGQHFIITAWHNVTGLHSETLKHLNKNLGVPDNVVANIVVNWRGVGSRRIPIALPLADEEKTLFCIHPQNWPRVDVVAIPFDPMADHPLVGATSNGEMISGCICLLDMGSTGVPAEICPVQKYLVPNKDVAQRWLDTVEVTEELFIPGYPHNVQDYCAQPVWKRATIASSVQDGWNGEPKFLVDSASQSGMSGSPVLYYSPNGVVRTMGITNQFSQDVAILAGIYVGRVGVKEDADPQIGTVWNQSVINEIIDGKCYERLPAEIEVSPRELEAAVREALSSWSREGLENVRNPQLPSRYYVQGQVMKQIGGRASPQRVLDAALEMANSYDGPSSPAKASSSDR